jgi:hypothetical protein
MPITQRSLTPSLWAALTLTVLLVGCGGGDDDAADSGTSGRSARTPTYPIHRESTPTQPAPANPSPAPAPAPLPTPSTANATLSWVAPTENTNGSALTDLSGYKIYYGTTRTQLTSAVTVATPGVSTYVVEGLPVGTTYYFAITALASDGTESALSSVASLVIG